MTFVLKWSAGVLAAVISGLVVYQLTVGASDDKTTTTSTSGSPTSGSHTSPPQPLSFVERVRGNWVLQSWTEAGGPITLGIEVSNGTLTVSDSGKVDWRMDLDEVGENNRPQPAIKCGGQTMLAGKIEGVPGGARNSETDWTPDLHSIDHSSTGEGWIWRALCGWAVIGTRAPYTATLDGPTTAPATRMEMANRYGTFRWSRPA